MVSDDRIEQSDRDRDPLLEEIRRRAEEAELRRLEEDETLDTTPPDVAPPPQPFPFSPERQDSSPTSPEADRVLLLGDRIHAALERGALDQAASLLVLLQTIAPADPRIPDYSLRMENMRGSVLSQQFGSLSSRKPAGSVSRKKLAGMLKRAESAYQQEHYDDAFRGTEEILKLDPENEAAIHLQEEIRRSRELSEVIKQEEARHREQEVQALEHAPSPTVPPPPQADEKIWGQTEIVAPDADGLEVDEEAPEQPPKPRIAGEILRRVATIRVPVKPLLIGAGAVVLLIAGYAIIHRLVNVVVPPTNTILITAPVVQAGDERVVQFAEGVAEELIQMVGRAEDVSVVSSFSAFQSSARGSTDGELSKSFGARFVLSSTMQLPGDSARWQLSVFDSVAGGRVWSSVVHMHRQEVYSHLSGIVRSVLGAIGIEAGNVHALVFPRVQNVPSPALDAYFSGRALLRSGDPGALQGAEQQFRQALSIDPTFANAHSALAWTIVQKAERDSTGANSALATALEHTQWALRSGERSQEDYQTLGMAEFLRGDTDKALEFLLEAASRNRNDAETHRWLAQVYLRRSMTEEALRSAEAALAYDPRNPASQFAVGVVRHLRGEFNEALPHMQALFTPGKGRFSPGAALYPDLLIYLHRPEDALAAAMECVVRNPGDPQVHYRYARICQIAGHSKDEWTTSLLRAESLLSDSLRTAQVDPVMHASLALVYTRLGEFKAARESGQRALELGPKNVDVLYMAAKMYALQKEKEKAIAFLNKATSRRFRLDYLVDLDLFNLRSEPAFLTAKYQ